MGNGIFLSRSHRVRVGGQLSEEVRVTSFVPQLSVLGPVLFLAYVNDIWRNLESTSKHFAEACIIQCVRKVAVHLGCGTQILLSVSKLPFKSAVVSLYSVVKQRLKCNTGRQFNCLIQFLLTMFLSIDFQHLL
jgi:hypothetical protein